MSAFAGCRALVTGASSGIGEEFARQLAAAGSSLVLTARRRDRLESLATELRERHGVDVQVFPADLRAPGAPLNLKSRLDAAGVGIDILVNNAGFGFQADFIDREWSDWEAVIDLDVKALTQMTHIFARDMIDRGVEGHILQVGSIFSFGGVPSFAVYSAAKAYVLAFSEALADELAPKGIGLTTLAPGVTRTEFFDTASHGRIPAAARKLVQTPTEVVREGLLAMSARRPLVVTGWMNKLLVFSRRIHSRKNIVRVMGLRART